MTSLDELVQQFYRGAKDPGTAYFLPSIILEQTLPAEPLAAGECYWGDVAAVSPGLPTRLCAAIDAGSICPPGTAANMSLTGLRIVGLSNVQPAQPPTVAGSKVEVSLAFGEVINLPPGVTVPPYLAVQGDFAIDLSCCESNDGASCQGSSTPQPVSGTFAVGLVGAVLRATLEVTESFSVTTTALSLTAQQLRFAFQTESPLIVAGEINTLLQEAFNAGASANAMAMINARLSEPRLLNALDRSLTAAFRSLANPPLLAFVASTLYRNAVQPGNAHYLPTLVKNASDPALDPYAAGGWDMPDAGQWYAAAGNTICGSIGAAKAKVEIQTPHSPVPLDLTDITVSGTSNMLPVPLLTVGNSVTGMVACNAVASWPQKLAVSGHFDLRVTCCVADKHRTDCTGEPEDYAASGTFVARFATATVAVRVVVSAEGDGLVATAEAIHLRCDPNVTDPHNITFDIDVTSIPAGKRQDWNDVIEGIFNSPKATSAIVDQIRDRLNADHVRARVSEIITKAIRSILTDQPELAVHIASEVNRSQA